MNKYHLRFMGALACLLATPLLASGTDTSKEWLKEVALLITDTEKAEFSKLKKDQDREAFIQLFWAKRDPTPQTEFNEFKEEYYRRLEYVENNFIYGYNRGVRTDQGEVYMRLGEPLRIFPQGENSQVWVYPTPSWIEYPKRTFMFVFSNDGTGFVIDRTRTEAMLIQALYSFPEAALLYPDLTAVPEYKQIKAFSPDSFEGKLIQQVESQGEAVFQIPFEQKILFTKAENLSSYLTLLLKIEPQLVLPEKLTVFGRLKSEVYSADFRQEKTLLEENDHFFVQVGIPVLPGEYKLYVGLKTEDEKACSLKEETVSVPNFWTRDFGISSLIASPEVRARESFRESGFNVFFVGNYSLVPYFSQVYTRQQALNVFYYIYNIAVDANQNCALQLEFELHFGEQVFKLNPQKVEKPTPSGMLLEGTQIPLAALPEPGNYTFVIKITDEIANATASQKLNFTLLESPDAATS